MHVTNETRDGLIEALSVSSGMEQVGEVLRDRRNCLHAVLRLVPFSIARSTKTWLLQDQPCSVKLKIQ